MTSIRATSSTASFAIALVLCALANAQSGTPKASSAPKPTAKTTVPPTAAKAPAPNPAPAPTPATAPRAVSGPGPNGELISNEPMILFALLNAEISVDFDETPAKEAVQYIQETLGIQMLARWRSDRNSTGMDPETPITMKFPRINALTALEGILEELSAEGECTWQLRSGFLEVGTKENLSRPAARRTKLYPINDLLYEVPYFNNAPNFNIDAALNQGGNFGGGGGGGTGGGGGGMGGGGGGFGGGGGGSGGGGGGGSLFGQAGASPERTERETMARNLIELIKLTVEPEAWAADWAFIDYTQDCLVVRAPDYVHRALGGYDFLPPPRNPYQGGLGGAGGGGRYVSMTVPMSFSQLRGFTPATVSGSAGGTGFGSGGGSPP